MLRALLFDLDGTLLRVESEEVFFRRYLTELGGRFAHVMAPERFVGAVMAATRTMIVDRDPARTNREVWAADFFSRTGLDHDQLLPQFLAFYRDVFPTLRGSAGPMPGAAEAVNAARTRGLDVVAATNPVFPRVAIDERLRWAGFLPGQFQLITSYEHMHFCKPHPEYYLEIADAIGCPPAACLMVGNHPIDDMAAKLAGMSTYLVSGEGTPAAGSGPVPDYAGPMSGVAAVVADLAPAAARGLAGEA
jgi:FMN phosphatase YigB (HAD superfamily)